MNVSLTPELAKFVEQEVESGLYSLCSGNELEREFEKVAIFKHSDGGFAHVARQLEDGSWTSKLGPEEDIKHFTVEALESRDYGKAHVFMKRKRSSSPST